MIFSKMKISAETANKLAGITDEVYKDGLSYKKSIRPIHS